MQKNGRLLPASAFYFVGMKRTKVAFTDLVSGLEYYCCIEGEHLNEETSQLLEKIIAERNVKMGRYNISPSPHEK